MISRTAHLLDYSIDISTARQQPGACAHLPPLAAFPRVGGIAWSLRSPTRQQTQQTRLTKCTASIQPITTIAAAIPGGLTLPQLVGVLGAVAALVLLLKRIYDTPSRTYDENVGDEYDAWAEEGILEYYWGEHIHLGYYSSQERAAGYKKKDFKQAKYDFIAEMLAWTGVQRPKRILDVGCGFGGTTRYLAKVFPDAQVIGVWVMQASVSVSNLTHTTTSRHHAEPQASRAGDRPRQAARPRQLQLYGHGCAQHDV